MSYICPRCGNKDSRYIGLKKGEPYCRLCVSFQGKEVCYEPNIKEETVPYIPYTLSDEQKEISQKIILNFESKKNTLIHAVCGAGKTELVFGVIGNALSKGLRVGFAIPRRDVVIELLPRLKSSFPNKKIISIYGGHNQDLDGEVIVLTTHQLYRYTKFFDLLVMDEIDAFPFEGNEMLINMFKHSVKGNYVLMSATPSKQILNEFSKEGNEIISLYTRFHKQPIPVPEIVNKLSIFKLIFIIKKLKKYVQEKKPLLIFEPTISMAEDTFLIISKFVKGGKCVHSKAVDREVDVSNFKLGKLKYLVTTSILERGITVKNLQVIINHSEHDLYSASQLIQISGRVGRKIGAESGDILFVCSKPNLKMKEAIDSIKHANTFLNKND